MSESETATGETNLPVYVECYDVPLVYFDMVPSHGIMNGAVQVELFARILHPVAVGSKVEIKFTTSGRLRCSPAAAKDLRDALDSALKMLEQAQPSPVAAAKLN